MPETSYFESRPGRLSCRPGEAFSFITDLRNFDRFIQEGTISNWKADKESCSFSVSMVGAVNIRLVSKDEGKKVIYQGDALSSNDFTIRVDLSDDLSDHSEIRLFLTADLNPVLKMMADKPIRQFLDILINEIEGFRDWHDIRV
jgi:hypothetical protein